MPLPPSTVSDPTSGTNTNTNINTTESTTNTDNTSSDANVVDLNTGCGSATSLHAHSANHTNTNTNQFQREDEDCPIFNMRDVLLLLKKAECQEDAAKVDHLVWHIYAAHRHTEVNKLMRRGLGELKRGVPKSAVQCFLGAHSIDPNYSDPQIKLAAINNQLNNHTECIRWSKQALRISPRQYHAMGVLAVSYDKMNRKDECEKMLRRALTIHPWTSHLGTLIQSVFVFSYRIMTGNSGTTNKTTATGESETTTVAAEDETTPTTADK